MSLLDDLTALYTRKFNWREDHLQPIRAIIAASLTPYLPGERRVVWAELVGAPATGKSSLLRTLYDDDRWATVMDDLSPAAFASAYVDPNNPTKDFSLMGQLGNSRDPVGPKLLLCPDTNSLYTMPTEQVTGLMGKLRAASDGEYHRPAGNKGLTNWKDLNFVVLLGSVPKMDIHRRDSAALGERLLTVRFDDDVSYAAGQKVADWSSSRDAVVQDGLGLEIKALTKRIIDEAKDELKGCTTDQHIRKPGDAAFHAGRLGLMLTRMRMAPYSQEEYNCSPENPPRLIAQLKGFIDCLAVVDGRREWSEEDYRIACRCVRDSLHPTYLKAIKALWRGDVKEAQQPMPAEDIKDRAEAGPSIFRQLDQWVRSDILTPFPPNKYGLKKLFAQDIQLTRVFDEAMMKR